ncbi:MAG: serine/threonine protein kinase [Deltaproteobacteria bacterium]|nr:serine/threonine protein kinase [Deltaproteobacteria bacterium]
MSADDRKSSRPDPSLSDSAPTGPIGAPPRPATIPLSPYDSFDDATDAKPAPVPDEALVGTILHGYRVVERVGEGAQSRVFRGRHMHLDREVAIKVLRGTISASSSARARLLREARVLTDLSHPNVIRVLDFGETTQGLPFLILEWLNGVPLRRFLKTERPSAALALAFAGQLAAALAAVHARGVTHRDVKPGNVMVVGKRGAEQLKLIDFGLAKVLDADKPLTAYGDVIGTPQYIAPESLVATTLAGPPADVYALGAIMFEVISGRPAFEGSLPEVLDAHRHKTAPPLEDERWDRWVQRAMAKNPFVRPTAASLFEEIVEASEGALEPTALATRVSLLEVEEAAPGPVQAPVMADSMERSVVSGVATRRRIALAAGSAMLACLSAAAAVHATRVSRRATERMELVLSIAKARRELSNRPSADLDRALEALEAEVLSDEANARKIQDELAKLGAKP